MDHGSSFALSACKPKVVDHTMQSKHGDIPFAVCGQDSDGTQLPFPITRCQKSLTSIASGSFAPLIWKWVYRSRGSDRSGACQTHVSMIVALLANRAFRVRLNSELNSISHRISSHIQSTPEFVACLSVRVPRLCRF